MKYNYVILGSNDTYSKIMFYDIFSNNNVKYITPAYLQDNLFTRIHLSIKINRFIKLPFKLYWFKKKLKNINFSDSNPICFIVTRSWLELGYNLGLFDFLRNTYPQSKNVMFFMDLFHTYKSLYPTTKKPFNIDLLRHEFDLLVSYDQGDCNKYGFKFYPDVYSKITLPQSANSYEYVDVFFCGRAKDRLSLILNIADQLVKEGLSIKFYIHTGNQSAGEQDIKGVYYINKSIDYIEYLHNVKHSKCLLEIMQNGALGYTLRSIEAICYNKMLLTNNTDIKKIPYFNAKYISVINNGILDKKFLENIKNNVTVEYDYDNFFSPNKFLMFIENNIQ